MLAFWATYEKRKKWVLHQTSNSNNDDDAEQCPGIELHKVWEPQEAASKSSWQCQPQRRGQHTGLSQSQHECQRLSALWGTIWTEIVLCPPQQSEHLCEETRIEPFTTRLGAAVAEAETNPEGKKKEMKYILVPVETSHLLWGRESGLCSLTWKRCPWDAGKWIRRGRGRGREVTGDSMWYEFFPTI